MVGAFDDVERGECAEFVADRFEQREIGEIVARALQEEHRLGDFDEMVAPFGGGLLRRMKRKAKENQAAHFGDQVFRGGGGSHAAAHRFAAGEKREVGRRCVQPPASRRRRSRSESAADQEPCADSPCKEIGSGRWRFFRQQVRAIERS